MAYSLPTIVKVPPAATEMIVEGTVHPNANRFTFTFSKEKDNENDVLMTFDVRFFQNEVVRNYRQNNWGTEEKQGGMPFKKGERYELRILITDDKYQVFVNKNHFCDYKFHLGKEYGRHLHVSGDQTIHKLNFPGCSEFALPYCVPVPPSATELCIEGVPFPEAKKLTFNFMEQAQGECDVLLHFDVRFNNNEVIRNHRQNNQWGPEEKHGGIPFRRGERYEVKFYFKGDIFQVYVNNAHFCDWKLRTGKENGRFLRISGETTISKAVFQPSSDAPHTGRSLDPGHSLNVPYMAPIPGGLHPKQKIIIAGVPGGTDRFSVNLLCGSDHNNSDVCLQFDVRFSFGSCIKQVVRNYKSGGSWGSEERHMHEFPFSANIPFEIEIRVKENELKIYVNDEKFTNFDSHIKPDKVTHLYIEGNVRLTEVKF